MLTFTNFYISKICKSKIYSEKFFKKTKSNKNQLHFYKERKIIIVYTSKFINLISLIISIIIYVFTSFFINAIDISINKVKFKADFISQDNLNQIQEQDIASNNFKKNNVIIPDNNEDVEKEEWYIKIDKISLKAPIQEGTTMKTMEDYVGHFEETPEIIGNVCLAAHNRGYKNNYFARIKELEEGDEIIYKYKNIEKIYKVTKHEIIKNTDWTNLEKTEENRITLITCVENEPQYRRCIQGIEK